MATSVLIGYGSVAIARLERGSTKMRRLSTG
jgi:hypothetical protein